MGERGAPSATGCGRDCGSARHHGVDWGAAGTGPIDPFVDTFSFEPIGAIFRPGQRASPASRLSVHDPSWLSLPSGLMAASHWNRTPCPPMPRSELWPVSTPVAIPAVYSAPCLRFGNVGWAAVISPRPPCRDSEPNNPGRTRMLPYPRPSLNSPLWPMSWVPIQNVSRPFPDWGAFPTGSRAAVAPNGGPQKQCMWRGILLTSMCVAPLRERQEWPRRPGNSILVRGCGLGPCPLLAGIIPRCAPAATGSRLLSSKPGPLLRGSGTVSLSLKVASGHCQRVGSLRSIASRTDCVDAIQRGVTTPPMALGQNQRK